MLDPDTLAKPVDDGGLGMALTDEDKDMVKRLDMSANSPQELELMARIGTAWADAIGENFARPHYPCEEDETQAYTPPASPMRRVPPPLPQYIAETLNDGEMA
jgi:hypothetical protein